MGWTRRGTIAPAGDERDQYGNRLRKGDTPGLFTQVGVVGPAGAVGPAGPHDGTQCEYGYNLATGCGTVSMRSGLAATLATSGVLWLGFFRAPKSFTANNVNWGLNVIASGGVITITRWGLYAVTASTGALSSLLGSTANDIALATTGASTTVRKVTALQAPVNLVADTWYAMGFLFVGTGTAPQVQYMLNGGGGSNNMPLGALPRINGFIAGQTDLPSSATGAAVQSGQNITPWAELV